LIMQHFLAQAPSKRSVPLWNSGHLVDSEFLAADCSSFLPHTTSGLVPEESLSMTLLGLILLSGLVQLYLNSRLTGRCVSSVSLVPSTNGGDSTV
jgi:hypothetical protein